MNDTAPHLVRICDTLVDPTCVESVRGLPPSGNTPNRSCITLKRPDGRGASWIGFPLDVKDVIDLLAAEGVVKQ